MIIYNMILLENLTKANFGGDSAKVYQFLEELRLFYNFFITSVSSRIGGSVIPRGKGWWGVTQQRLAFWIYSRLAIEFKETTYKVL